LRGFGVCFFVGGFWNAPDDCVNGGTFRQDERGGQDMLRVGTFGLHVFVVGIITSLKLLRVHLLYLITIIDGGELNE